MTKKYDDDFDIGDAQGTSTGMSSEQWEYPAIGYNLSNGKLYLDSEVVDKITVTVMQVAVWKEVTKGKGKNLQVLGKYHIKAKKNGMIQGDKVRPHVQVIMKVNDKLHVFGATSQNGYGMWMKRGAGDSQYYAFELEQGFWYQLQAHIRKVLTLKGKSIPQYGWEFDLMPSKTTITTGGEFDISIYPLVRSAFRFVGQDQLTANEKLYLAENLDEWKETKSNPAGVVEQQVEDTVEAQEETLDEVPYTQPEEDEVPF